MNKIILAFTLAFPLGILACKSGNTILSNGSTAGQQTYENVISSTASTQPFSFVVPTDILVTLSSVTVQISTVTISPYNYQKWTAYTENVASKSISIDQLNFSNIGDRYKITIVNP